jgi:hypothetical protein
MTVSNKVTNAVEVASKNVTNPDSFPTAIIFPLGENSTANTVDLERKHIPLGNRLQDVSYTTTFFNWPEIARY